MKMRKFEFTDAREGRTDFLIAYQSFRQQDPEKATKEERPYLAAAQRVLDKISEPQGALPEDADDFTIDMRFRKLLNGPQSIEISQKVHEKIEGWVENGKFQAPFAVAIEDFLARWGQAEKKDDDAPGPVGVAKKAK